VSSVRNGSKIITTIQGRQWWNLGDTLAVIFNSIVCCRIQSLVAPPLLELNLESLGPHLATVQSLDRQSCGIGLLIAHEPKTPPPPSARLSHDAHGNDGTARLEEIEHVEVRKIGRNVEDEEVAPIWSGETGRARNGLNRGTWIILFVTAIILVSAHAHRGHRLVFVRVVSVVEVPAGELVVPGLRQSGGKLNCTVLLMMVASLVLIDHVGFVGVEVGNGRGMLRRDRRSLAILCGHDVAVVGRGRSVVHGLQLLHVLNLGEGGQR